MGKAKYCAHCGQAISLATPETFLRSLDQRLARVEEQLRMIDMQDPRIGAEGWHDTIRRIARDVLRQEGR